MWDLYLVILKISEKNVSGITLVQNWNYWPNIANNILSV